MFLKTIKKFIKLLLNFFFSNSYYRLNILFVKLINACWVSLMKTKSKLMSNQRFRFLKNKSVEYLKF